MRRLNSPHDETPRRSETDWVARLKGSTVAGIIVSVTLATVGYFFIFGSVLGALVMTVTTKPITTLPPPVDSRATVRKSSDSVWPLRRADGSPLWQKQGEKK